MGFGYKQRECETCGGQLVYLSDTKDFRCSYCGNRYDRTESYDGQFSVRHAAHQVLSALSNSNLELAEENLNDCNKIDPAYSGSIIAAIAFHIEKARYAPDHGSQQNEIAQAISFFKKMEQPFEAESSQCDTEVDFYENLDSADVRSVLISTYKLLNDQGRMSFLKEGFHAESIHSEKAAIDVLSYAASEGEFAQVDALLRSSATVDTGLLVDLLLNSYPACDQKTENIRLALKRTANPCGFRTALSTYLSTSQDDISCKISVLESFSEKGVAARGDAVATLLKGSNEHDVVRLAAVVRAFPQSDEDVDQILGACFSYLKSNEMQLVLDALAASGSFLSFSQECMMSMLSRADLTREEKILCLDVAKSHGLTEKRKQSVFGAVLMAPFDPEEKIALISVIADSMSAVNPMTAERYLMDCGSDADKKPDVVKALFSRIEAKGSLEYAANRYATSNADDLAVHNAVVQMLAREGFIKTARNFDGFLQTGDEDYALNAARDMKEAGVKLGPNVLQEYLEKTLGTPEYSSRLFAEFVTAESRVTPETFVRFLFEAPDEEGKAAKVKTLYDRLTCDLNGYRTKVSASGGTVDASVFHSYLIGNRDGSKTAEAVARLLLTTVAKPNSEVLLNGKPMKFKKLLQSGAAQLPDPSRSFCSSIRLV